MAKTGPPAKLRHPGVYLSIGERLRQAYYRYCAKNATPERGIDG
jgi:hypothetical protein